MTEHDSGIQTIVVVPPPPVSLGTPKPNLSPYDALLTWATSNEFYPAPCMDEYDDDGRFIEPNVRAYWKNARYEPGQPNRFCELYVAEFQHPAEFVREVFLRGEYGFWQPKPFEFACTYEYALVFLKRHFAF